ncbi:MAG: DUF3817 domain-containing protein [Candidatus Kapaibacteriota bacterium]
MFSTVAHAEVISYILLLVVAVPLKYLGDDPRGVKVLGPIHGVLFVAYCLMVLRRSNCESWPWKRTFWALFAAFLPLGPIGVAKK